MNQLEISFGSPLRVIHTTEEPTLSRLTVTDGLKSITAKGNIMYTMPVDYSVTMQVSYVDIHGNPAEVQTVSWTSSDIDTVEVHVDPNDSTLCVVQAKGKVGQAQVTATADADLGAGVRNIVTLCDLTVVAGEAVSGTIAPVGDPVPPQAAPAA